MGGFRHVTMVNKGGFRQSLMLVQQWRRHRKRGKRNGSNYSSGRGQKTAATTAVADHLEQNNATNRTKTRAVSATSNWW